MKAFLFLLALTFLASCGKPNGGYKVPIYQDGLWFKNDSPPHQMKTKEFALIQITDDSTYASDVRVNFPLTSKSMIHARVLSYNKKWTLDIRNYKIKGCSNTTGDKCGSGIDSIMCKNNCVVEISGLPVGNYLLEY